MAPIPARTGLRRAAQYLRMSREHQKYSPINQAEAIARYAADTGLEVVQTYSDDGRSGLSLKGRQGLQQLLTDAVSGKADFRHVLVLDVSRWGRFQDPDQAAHYEFICREAGLQVHYCSEPFENDGSTAATVLKHLKRVMAAEYSRQLGDRVWAGQAHGARAGFKQGGAAPFGLRRQLQDEHGKPIRLLSHGQRKSVQTDRVVLVQGPAHEVRGVRQAFRWFANDGLCFREILGRLEAAGVRNENGRALTRAQLARILRNDVYTGVYTWNRTHQRLGQGIARNDPEAWVRQQMVEPIVSAKLFARTKKRLADRYRAQPRYSDAELLQHLQRVQAVRGEVSIAILEAEEHPSYSLYYRRFGSLAEALRLAEVPQKFVRRVTTRRWTRERLIKGLEGVLAAHGYISDPLIRESRDLPSASYVRGHFGSLAAAYRAAGWEVEEEDLCVLANERRWAREGSQRAV